MNQGGGTIIGPNVNTIFMTGVERAGFIGGSANDTFIVQSDNSSGFDGGGGTNTIDFSQSTAGVTINLISGTGTGGYAQGDTFQNIQVFEGSKFNDTFIAGPTNATFIGNGGMDTVVFTGPKANYDIAVSGENIVISGRGHVETL